LAFPVRNYAWLALLAAVSGCGGDVATKAGTGAREAVQQYYDALLQRDWQRAYAALLPESQLTCSQEDFIRLAQAYRDKLGFAPEKVNVWSCDERGAEAIAHIVLTGHEMAILRRYKDNIVLHQSAGSWRVILPKDFGQ
jgi:hypothetical protein